MDVVQRRAEKLCGVTFQPLGARREASCFGLICKLLDEVCVQPLLDMCPQFQLEGASVNSAVTRSSNVQVTDMIGKLRTSKSLQAFSWYFIAQARHIFGRGRKARSNLFTIFVCHSTPIYFLCNCFQHKPFGNWTELGLVPRLNTYLSKVWTW